jgi:hypothetical protein
MISLIYEILKKKVKYKENKAIVTRTGGMREDMREGGQKIHSSRYVG